MIDLTHNWSCKCGQKISGYDTDSRVHLARQLGGTLLEYEDNIRCNCGESMTCTWSLLDGISGDEYNFPNTGWNSEPTQQSINLAKGRMR